MERNAAQCSICGKTLLPEEIEIGKSLICPRCDPKRQQKERSGDDARPAKEEDGNKP